MPEFLNPTNNSSSEESDDGSSKESQDRADIKSGSQTSSPMAPHDGEVIEYAPRRRENKKSVGQENKPKQRNVESKSKPDKPYVSNRHYDAIKSDLYPRENIFTSVLDFIKNIFSYLFLPEYAQRRPGAHRGNRNRYNRNYRNRRSGGRNRRQGTGTSSKDNSNSRNHQNNRGSSQSQSNNKDRRGGRYKAGQNQERESTENTDNNEPQNSNRSRNRRRGKPRTEQPKTDKGRECDPQ